MKMTLFDKIIKKHLWSKQKGPGVTIPLKVDQWLRKVERVRKLFHTGFLGGCERGAGQDSSMPDFPKRRAVSDKPGLRMAIF